MKYQVADSTGMNGPDYDRWRTGSYGEQHPESAPASEESDDLDDDERCRYCGEDYLDCECDYYEIADREHEANQRAEEPAAVVAHYVAPAEFERITHEEET